MPYKVKDAVQQNNTLRSEAMGDKGGKKSKEKSQKQHTEKNKQKEQDKISKQPKKKA